MKAWRVEMTAGGKSLAEAKTPRVIVQRRCTITITVCNSDDATQLHTQEMHCRIKT